MIQTGIQRLKGVWNSLLSIRKKPRRLLLESAWLIYIIFTIIAYPYCEISILLPSLLLCGFATWLYQYKIGLLTAGLSLPYNMLIMMYHLDSLQGWNVALEPGGYIAQLLIVSFITIVKNNYKKTIELTLTLEKRIQQRNEELQEVSEYMINYSEAKRAEISKKLCSIVNNQLTDLLHHSETLVNFLSYTNSPQAVDAAKLVKIAEKNIEEVSDLTEKLSPQTMTETGFKKTLEKMCSNLTKTVGTEFSIVINNPDQKIPEKIALPLYRITHEAVTNAMRHAKSEHINIQLEINNETFSLTIINDGLPMPDLIAQGTGLHLIHQRASDINAKVQYSQDSSGRTLFKCISI